MQTRSSIKCWMAVPLSALSMVLDAEAGLLTSQRVIEEMFQDIVMNGTDVNQAAAAAEKKLNDLFETVS